MKEELMIIPMLIGVILVFGCVIYFMYQINPFLSYVVLGAFVGGTIAGLHLVGIFDDIKCKIKKRDLNK